MTILYAAQSLKIFLICKYVCLYGYIERDAQHIKTFVISNPSDFNKKYYIKRDFIASNEWFASVVIVETKYTSSSESAYRERKLFYSIVDVVPANDVHDYGKQVQIL